MCWRLVQHHLCFERKRGDNSTTNRVLKIYWPCIESNINVIWISCHFNWFLAHQNQRLKLSCPINWRLLSVTFLHFDLLKNKYGFGTLPKLCLVTLPDIQNGYQASGWLKNWKSLKIIFLWTTGSNEKKYWYKYIPEKLQKSQQKKN